MPAPADPATRDWTFASVYALAFLTLVSTLNYFDRSVLSLMLPLIKKDFHVSDTTLGVVTSLIAIYALLGVPVAWLAERWSRRNIVAIGLAFWSLMTALTGMAGSIWQLGATRTAVAIGESAGLAPSQSILSDMFSSRARPVVLSIITTASSIALLLYSPLAGWIAGQYGWRAAMAGAWSSWSPARPGWCWPWSCCSPSGSRAGTRPTPPRPRRSARH